MELYWTTPVSVFTVLLWVSNVLCFTLKKALMAGTWLAHSPCRNSSTSSPTLQSLQRGRLGWNLPARSDTSPAPESDSLRLFVMPSDANNAPFWWAIDYSQASQGPVPPHHLIPEWSTLEGANAEGSWVWGLWMWCVYVCGSPVIQIKLNTMGTFSVCVPGMHSLGQPQLWTWVQNVLFRRQQRKAVAV